ncbi:DUF4236 domain-containing protein [Rosenbergiella collisarenosi]|uniref:DUF4236 domain-containing protein n=1 Tax=Rosenbergiella collisarenosi TaxID=1544695 RepID=UPI001F4E8E6F|nr:DUF4236 domain-containing protein [Rosenbergiella collisarenosi]
MGLRFRKTISIMPGVRINLSGSGASMSVGPRDASVTFGKSGAYANFGLPGTGLSYRTRLDRACSSTRQRSQQAEANPQLRNELEREVTALNNAVESIINIHLFTPDPRTGHSLEKLRHNYRELALKPYSVPAPVRPDKPVPLIEPNQPDDNHGRGLIGRILESADVRHERQRLNLERWQREVETCQQENALMLKKYQTARQIWAEQYSNWQYEAAKHNKKSQDMTGDIDRRFEVDSTYFESLLTEELQLTDWPRETLVTFQVEPENSVVMIEVDCPEAEDIPTSTVRVNTKGTEIIEKEISQKAIRERYALHVHGILMRMVGVAFWTLPFEKVIISGFTQRISKQSGYLEDEYILSARINRWDFEALNFSNLEYVNPVEAFERFEVQRRMSSTYIFQPITPFIA